AFAGKVTGYITDNQQGLPVSGASVQITGIGFAISSPDGFFSFPKVPAGHYRLVVTAQGYRADSLSFVVNDQKAVVLHVVLQSFSAVLDTVSVVRGMDRTSALHGRMLEKASVPLMHVISRQSIEQSADITVADMMQRVSGVSVLRNATGMPGR